MDRLPNFVKAHPVWTLVILMVLVIVLILEIVYFIRKEKFVPNQATCSASAGDVDPTAAHEILGLNMAQGLSPDAVSHDAKRDLYNDYLYVNYGIGPYATDVTSNPDFVDDYDTSESAAPTTPVQKPDNKPAPDMSNPDSS